MWLRLQNPGSGAAFDTFCSAACLFAYPLFERDLIQHVENRVEKLGGMPPSFAKM